MEAAIARFAQQAADDTGRSIVDSARSLNHTLNRAMMLVAQELGDLPAVVGLLDWATIRLHLLVPVSAAELVACQARLRDVTPVHARWIVTARVVALSASGESDRFDPIDDPTWPRSVTNTVDPRAGDVDFLRESMRAIQSYGIPPYPGAGGGGGRPQYWRAPANVFVGVDPGVGPDRTVMLTRQVEEARLAIERGAVTLDDLVVVGGVPGDGDDDE